ncbi:UNKNOWN [Stylonychia lemnae]|uniref:Uncharacterized protein n=1 Tax=Stylonychia lemnae TaxID=5949 RepID=A0A078B5K7_STYLE|nr:UNKNOWN [Stylonychia lemnae]|eukprot:CDW88587.1 UNKNOWN [Stylonychia lemnae]
MATVQDLSYNFEHKFWQQRVNKELVQKMNFENVLIDNISEIEQNCGKVVVPSQTIRPQLQATTSFSTLQNGIKLASQTNLNNGQNQIPGKNYFLVNSSYVQASNPNSMRDLGQLRGVLDLQQLMNQQPAIKGVLRSEPNYGYRPASTNLVRGKETSDLLFNNQKDYNQYSTSNLRTIQDYDDNRSNYTAQKYQNQGTRKAKRFIEAQLNQRNLSTIKVKKIQDAKFKGKVFDPDAKIWSFRYGGKLLKVNEIFRESHLHQDSNQQHQSQSKMRTIENNDDETYSQFANQNNINYPNPVHLRTVDYKQNTQSPSVDYNQNLMRASFNQNPQSQFLRTMNQSDIETKSRSSRMSLERLQELKASRAYRKGEALSYRSSVKGGSSSVARSIINMSQGSFNQRTTKLQNRGNDKFIDQANMKHQMKMTNSMKNKSLKHIMMLTH